MKPLLLAFCFAYCSLCHAQERADSVKILEEVQIEAFRYNRPAAEVPAAIQVVDEDEINRLNTATLLPAMNVVPGLRMEERSPGSYRLSIRGSLIRSPFGIRNVKMYWNGLPFTDAGGNTYLNLIDPSVLSKIEVIKGPGSSLYGAGTGGVVLLTSRKPSEGNANAELLAGSYGLRRVAVRGELGNKNVGGSLHVTHQESDGYREQSALERSTVNSDFQFTLSPKTFGSATLMYSRLSYETPGGLTISQYKDDAQQARPAAGPNRGAVEQDASVTNNSVYGGLTLARDWSEKFSTNAVAYASFSDFQNLAIANYEQREENNHGFRIDNQYTIAGKKISNKISFGVEYQRMVSPIRVYSNNFGKVGDLTISDDLVSRQSVVFVQSELTLPKGFYFTAGISSAYVLYDFERAFPETSAFRKRIATVLSPRVALLKKFDTGFSLYTSVSQGFSPPTLAEIRPSTNAFNNDLQSEKGLNYEVGGRGVIGNFTYDVTGYVFRLRETIVQQRLDNGAEYFVNAGETNQRGLEAFINYSVLPEVKMWLSYAYNHYRFADYDKDGLSFAGNRLTGVAPQIANVGIDVNLLAGVYLNTMISYTARIPLNDANTEYAGEYYLLNVKLGYRTKLFDRTPLEIFAGSDNLLDRKFSLGNDLNAFGGRYYNVAPGRQFYAGIKCSIK
jgi:iron complex outermembrane recepter protein